MLLVMWKVQTASLRNWKGRAGEALCLLGLTEESLSSRKRALTLNICGLKEFDENVMRNRMALTFFCIPSSERVALLTIPSHVDNATVELTFDLSDP